MKDHEIDRIPDKLTQTRQAKTVISNHNEMLRTERLTQPDRFKKTSGGFTTITNMQASAKVLSQSKKNLKQQQYNTQNKTSEGGNTTFVDGQPVMGDVKQVNVKTANKSIRSMRGDK